MGLNNRSPFRAIAEQFELYERRTDEVLLHQGKRKPISTEEELAKAIYVVKQAGAAVLVSPYDIAFCKEPEDIPIGMQIRNRVIRDAGNTGGTLECPGGAYLTDQERQKLRETGTKLSEAPGNLFYQILLEKLMAGETQPEFTYDDKRKTDRLVANVRLEITQEMGSKAAKDVRLIRQINRKPRLTDLTNINFNTPSDKTLNKKIVDKHGAQFSIEEKEAKTGTKIAGIITRVSEHAMIADVDDVETIASKTVRTEEANGMYVYTAGELLHLFSLGTEGESVEERVDSWENFEQRHRGLIRPRAPSTAWQIRMLFEYLDRQTKQAAGSSNGLRLERGVLAGT